MNAKQKIATMVATAAAVAFVAAPLASVVAQASSHKVPCYGVNSCKGKSACKTSKNTCKGKNACKGQGYLKKSASQCKKLGGTTGEQ